MRINDDKNVHPFVCRCRLIRLSESRLTCNQLMISITLNIVVAHAVHEEFNLTAVLPAHITGANTLACRQLTLISSIEGLDKYGV